MADLPREVQECCNYSQCTEDLSNRSYRIPVHVVRCRRPLVTNLLEVFGPVICVYSFEHLDQAIQRANRLDVSFQAAVFTQNIDTALRACRRLNASAVMVNDHTAFRIDGMPFAGLKHSGLGTGGIPYTIEEMQVDKMVVWKSNEL